MKNIERRRHVLLALCGVFFLFTLSASAIAQQPRPCDQLQPTFTFGNEVSAAQRELIQSAVMTASQYVCAQTTVAVPGFAVFAYTDLDKISQAYAQFFNVPL